jgi:hypothetical protein
VYNLNYIHQPLRGYKVEEKLYLGVREQKRLNASGIEDSLVGVHASFVMLGFCSFLNNANLTLGFELCYKNEL